MPANLKVSIPASGVGTEPRLDGFHLVRDIYDAAVARLVRAGFCADVRQFNLDSMTELRTVAVYVQAMDSRLAWSARRSKSAPLAFHYRRNDRSGYEFTLFSGANVREVTSFVDRLLHFHGTMASTTSVALSTGEWDPHRLPESQQKSLDAYMSRHEALHASVRPGHEMNGNLIEVIDTVADVNGAQPTLLPGRRQGVCP